MPLRAVLLALIMTLLAGPAEAATTITPDRLDDPLVGTNCAAGHPAGSCSLRAANAAAANGDTVALGEGTYVLSHGELLVTKSVALSGMGTWATTIQQATVGARVIRFDVGTTASMRGLTVTGGNLMGTPGAPGTAPTPAGGAGGGVSGGGIDGEGTLTLTLVAVIGNSVAAGNGGNGFATGGAGGDGGFASGAGINACVHLTLDRVTVAGNVAHGGDGGNGGNGNAAGAGGAGGKGMAASAAVNCGLTSALVVRDSTISANKAFAGRGGDGGNGGSGGGNGGAGGRSVRGAGGGIFANSQITLTNTTLAANELHGGNGGKGGNGGGGGSGGAGGVAEAGDSGGIALFNGAHGHFASVTLVANGAFAGTGGAGGTGAPAGAAGSTSAAQGGNYDAYGATTTLAIRDSVIAGGVAGALSSNCAVGGGATITSQGFNLEDLNQCVPVPQSSDRHGIDPKLGPLQDNGGSTKTIAPLAGSPLVDGGPPSCLDAAGLPLIDDQRGIARTAPCDIGAYEAVAPTATKAPAVSGTPRAGELLSCTGATFAGDGPQTLATTWLLDGQPAGADAQYTVAAADVGHAIACRITATNAYGAASSDSAPVTIEAAPPPPPGAGVKAPRISKLRVRHAKVTFTLSAPAMVRFSLCRYKGKRCKRLKKHAPKTFSAKAGKNAVKLARKHLKPGRYRITATPSGGKPAHATFRLKP